MTMRKVLSLTFYFLSLLLFFQGICVGNESSPAQLGTLSYFSVSDTFGNQKLQLLSNKTLAPSKQIKKVIFIIHGLKRNFRDYYEMLIGILSKNKTLLKETVVIAPHFLNQEDLTNHSIDFPKEILYWNYNEWKYGQDSATRIPVSSFQVMDDFILALKSHYPDLQQIVIASHSAGSQWTQRYAALNSVDQKTLLYWERLG